MSPFLATLEDYGADLDRLRLFDDETPALLPYDTLIRARPDDSELSALHGVYEWLNSPLIFLVDGEQLKSADQLRRIRRMVALRGDAPYLGVVQPGRLTVHRISLDGDSLQHSNIKLLPNPDRRATFAWLANRQPDSPSGSSKHEWISDVVLRLLDESILELTSLGVNTEDALSLTGRALFVRFLGDRDLVPKSKGAVHTLFSNATRAEETSVWLDKTFNGDFLPLSPYLFGTLKEHAFEALSNILYRAPGGQLFLGWEHKWDFLHFAHIPVGVLSQAYERHLRRYAPARQRKEGAYYTPPVIANLMVRGAFHALRRDGAAHTAHVLDPAAGAGVFLLAAFRQLVAEHWAADGKRPNTATLRKILYRQLVGFDINEAALRFAALGLYLMSIELDPDPKPVRKLKFKNLRGTVLLKVSDNNPGRASCGLGSLGPAVGAEYMNRFDLVIGNPPWASSTKLPGWSEVTQRIASIARGRLSPDAPTPPIPNQVLDLPFVWRAMEWARPAGQIALALHARLLFQQGDGMPAARQAIFDALDVTGILNGTALRNTKVWPESSAPFCLLFANNRKPPIGAGFRFVSPQMEDDINGAGGLRVDAQGAAIMTSQQIAEQPVIFKILFRGTALDLEIFKRMSRRNLVSLKQYWCDLFGLLHGRPKQAGNGYQLLRNSTRRPQESGHMVGLRHLEYEGSLPPLLNSGSLPWFTKRPLHRARNPKIYKASLLVVHKSPPAAYGRIRTAVADFDLVYNQTYYGYSAHGHSDAQQLVRYLALLLGSQLSLWHVLMTSGEFGFEREAVEKSTIDSIPVIPFEQLNGQKRRRIDTLFNAVVRTDNEQTWARVDAWVASLYGLDERDLQIINDTLAFNLPFARNRRAAQQPVATEQMRVFCDVLRSELEPWLQGGWENIDVRPTNMSSSWPWAVVQVHMPQRNRRRNAATSNDWPKILRLADALGATEVLYPDQKSNSLWIARLRQARYWSQSQAVLVARQIAWQYPDILVAQGHS